MEFLIVGPQSGPSAVPVDPAWQQSIRDACSVLRIPLFEKSDLPIQPPIRQMPADLAGVFRKGLPEPPDDDIALANMGMADYARMLEDADEGKL